MAWNIGIDGEPVDKHLEKYFPERIKKSGLNSVINFVVTDKSNLFLNDVIRNSKTVKKAWTSIFQDYTVLGKDNHKFTLNEIIDLYKTKFELQNFIVPYHYDAGVTDSPDIYEANWMVKDIMIFYNSLEDIQEGDLSKASQMVILPIGSLTDENYFNLESMGIYLYMNIFPRNDDLTNKNPIIIWDEEELKERDKRITEYETLDKADIDMYKSIFDTCVGKNVAICRMFGNDNNNEPIALYSHPSDLLFDSIEIGDESDIFDFKLSFSSMNSGNKMGINISDEKIKINREGGV